MGAGSKWPLIWPTNLGQFTIPLNIGQGKLHSQVSNRWGVSGGKVRAMGQEKTSTSSPPVLKCFQIIVLPNISYYIN